MSQRDKPREALNNITAGVRERESVSRTRVAGHLDEIQGVVASALKLFRIGASLLAKAFGVGFIDWLDLSASKYILRPFTFRVCESPLSADFLARGADESPTTLLANVQRRNVTTPVHVLARVRKIAQLR
jgi:hypothetical protein